MKTLLVAINAKYIHTNLAVRYLKNYAVLQGFSPQIAEYTINEHFDDILGNIYLKKPEVLCFSCYLWNVEIVRNLSRELKKLLPGLQIWCGGPEVSMHPLSFLEENPAVDLIMCGEGEQIFSDLLSALENQHPLATVKGIVFRQEGHIVQTPSAPPFDMSRLPFAYDDLPELHHKILYFETSRGCPFSCTYCLSSATKGVHTMPVELACQYLDRFLAAKVPQVKFVDRTFNCSKQHANAILSYLLAHDNLVTNFHFEISADILDESTLALISQAREGLFQFEVGVQSTNPQTISSIRRSCDNHRLFANTAKLQSLHNVHIHADLIAGLPYEDYRSFAASFDDVFSMKPDMLQLGFLKVLKGSAMEAEAPQYDIRYQSRAPYEVLSTRWLSYDDILKLKKVERLVDMYYNSGRFQSCLPMAMAGYDSPFQFFEGLALFFSEQGLLERQAGKYDYYNFLYDFFKKSHGASQNFCWAARHDIFCRENAKSPPEWASCSLFSIYRDKIEDFFANQICIEHYVPWLSGQEARRISKIVHLEVYPVNPVKGTDETTAFLYDYSYRDINGNAKVYDVGKILFR